MNQPIDIILPIYDGFEFLEPLFKSIYLGTTISHRILVIEDCSTDKKVKQFLNTVNIYKNNHCLGIIVKLNPINLGFIKSVNSMVSIVKNNFVILNTDVEVPKNWLQRLMLPINTDNKIASTTPFTNSGTICSFPNWLGDNELPLDLSVDEVDSYFKDVSQKYHTKIPTGVGFCMGVNKKVVDEIGFFDEGTFLFGYGEENDWCLRAAKSGYRNIHVTNLFVYHKHGGSFGNKKYDLLKRNMEYLLKKNPTYAMKVKWYIIRNPLKHLRNDIFKKILTDKAESYINTVFTGGTYSFLVDRANIVPVIIIDCRNFSNKIEVKLRYHEYTFNYSFKSLSEIVSYFKLKEITINHIINVQKIEKLVNHILDNCKGIDLNIYIHDFFAICPTVTLLNDKSNYCEIPCHNACQKCFSNYLTSEDSDLACKKYVKLYHKDFQDIKDWRTLWEHVFDRVTSIIVPSNSTESILNKAYASKHIDKVRVVAHNLDYTKEIIKKKYSYKHSKTMNVYIIGDISNNYKGKNILIGLLHETASLKLNICYHVIGKFNCKEFIDTPYLHVVGEYKREHIVKIINKAKIDIFLFLSIWPETFSYVINEMKATGLPIILFNLGAPGELMRNHSNAVLVNKVDYKHMFYEIENCYSQFN